MPHRVAAPRSVCHDAARRIVRFALHVLVLDVKCPIVQYRMSVFAMRKLPTVIGQRARADWWECRLQDSRNLLECFFPVVAVRAMLFLALEVLFVKNVVPLGSVTQ